jgi:hypothetical protein
LAKLSFNTWDEANEMLACSKASISLDFTRKRRFEPAASKGKKLTLRNIGNFNHNEFYLGTLVLNTARIKYFIKLILILLAKCSR